VQRSVTFRCDAWPGIGGGHVARCLNLARELARRGWTTAFAVSPRTLETMPRLQSQATCILVPEGERADFTLLRREVPGGCDVLVLDPFTHNVAVEHDARGWGRRIVAIDDVGAVPHVCDLVVRSTVTSLPRTPGYEVLLGPGYALLDPAFADARPQALARRASSDVVRRILVFFGVTDRRAMVLRTLQALAEMTERYVIDAVLGRTAPSYAEANALGERIGPDVHLLSDLDSSDMIQLSAEADIAVGACGVAAFERCCLGLPSVAVMTAGNQSDTRQMLRDKDAAVVTPEAEALSIPQLRQYIRELTDVPLRRREISARGASLCDGLGTLRTADAIERLAA
jgi:UDP-2,4-diacetamido-2,4,6-trideoxy-beta-L-altropyranose hydrolase